MHPTGWKYLAWKLYTGNFKIRVQLTRDSDSDKEKNVGGRGVKRCYSTRTRSQVVNKTKQNKTVG